MDPVEVGGGELIMGLNDPAVPGLLREPQLRLGPALEIFLFFPRHLTWTFDAVSKGCQTAGQAAPFPGIALTQVVDPGESEGRRLAEAAAVAAGPGQSGDSHMTVTGNRGMFT
jgi:hypothetical protein